MWLVMLFVFFFQAEDGIRDLVRSRGLGDVYKRQVVSRLAMPPQAGSRRSFGRWPESLDWRHQSRLKRCLLYTSAAADERSSVDLGGRRIIKKKKR